MFFISMFWPGVVLNQGQMSIIISDWELYLGSLFATLVLCDIVFVQLLQPTERYVRFGFTLLFCWWLSFK
jgi:hypothetical protein